MQEKNQAAPPWVAEPSIEAGSIGWRMGPGEDAYNRFYLWFSALSEERAQAYEQENPEPSDWRGFYRKVRQNPWK